MPDSSIERAPGGNLLRREHGISAVQQVYEDVRNQIINLILEPGTTISKNEVAQQYGISPTPVREAMLRLGEEGLVNIFPQSRTSVSLIDIQQAREIHFLRLSVEIEVVRGLAKSIEKPGIDELKAWIGRQNTELKAGDQNAFKLADNHFHEEMFEQAGVQGLMRLLDTRRGHYDRIRGLFLMVQARRQTVIKEHRAIVAALENGDEIAAEAAVREHLGKSLAIVDDIRDRYPSYFL